ncbi:EFR1 family ferrodoxin [Haloplasma contractile]|uniref:DNA-directed RNA polymerase subunit D protein n=1 Tax=Haloplasma contractile SSD-17B TaxID=1033810 RepID=U2FKC1_9MOLU|nr:EFR1 family ferrodoxin [Haloplasma contractile]ERJ13260.1 DNA-directed RNA polymerase subunit D protein [Haloplasma contractile SSD-17B]
MNLNRKSKVIILYHSGAGSTKTIAEVFYETLSKEFICELNAINLVYNYDKLIEYDLLIIGFPTYHCEPSQSIMDFIGNLPKFTKVKNAFIFTTYGLFSGNTERIFIKLCKEKNIDVCGSNAYKAPATDGVLLFPPLKFMFKYGKNVSKKVKNDEELIRNLIMNKNKTSSYKPRFKLYTILNYPNKKLGQKYKHKLTIIEDQCIGCNKCINACIRDCWRQENNSRIWEIQNCEFCFKCVHQCITSAIILSKMTHKKSKLNNSFYKKLKHQLLEEIQLNKKC